MDLRNFVHGMIYFVELYFQSNRKEREKGRYLTNTFWNGSKKVFDDQLKSKLLEAKPSVLKECSTTKDSKALQVDCCSCFDCNWVNCDQQRQAKSYSKF